jgi:predicted HAD superfamily Cof-like phosphohydrolase
MTDATLQKTDPWAMQRALMAASGQNLPSSPELNKGVILYAALNLEEMAETLQGLCSALSKVQPLAELPAITELLADVHTRMLAASKSTRALLATVPDDFRAPLSEEDLLEMVDGTTDTTVTNCGFAASLGVDGATCYREVGGSNLSKANPDTGVIDKTADGKWIKGRNYRAPNLRNVLFGDAR